MKTYDLLYDLIGDAGITEAVIDELRDLGERTAIERKITPDLKKWLTKHKLVLVPLGQEEISQPAVMESEEWWSGSAESVPVASQPSPGDRVRYITPPDGRKHTQLGTAVFREYQPKRGDYPYRVEINGQVQYLHKSSIMECLGQ